MIHFERSFDYDLVRQILTDPKIWPHISDDSSPAAEDYYPIESEMVWYVMVRDIFPDTGPEEILGLFMFVPQNGVCWEVHTCLLPCAWGDRGQRAARLLPEWIWENTHCRRIVTNVPTPNRLALHFACKAGLKVYGVNEASYLKNGVLCDQVCLGISKPGASHDRHTVDAALESVNTALEAESGTQSRASDFVVVTTQEKGQGV